jgi:hypothetical protein
MVAGNPKTGRIMAACAVALLFAMIVLTVFVALRKQATPQKQPLLHTSTLFVMP